MVHVPVTSCKVLTAACGSMGISPQWDGVRRGSMWVRCSHRAGEGLGALSSTARDPDSASRAQCRGPTEAGSLRGTAPRPCPGLLGFATRPFCSRHPHQGVNTWEAFFLSCDEGARELWLHAGAVVEGNEGHRAGERTDQEVSAGRR